MIKGGRYSEAILLHGSGVAEDAISEKFGGVNRVGFT